MTFNEAEEVYRDLRQRFDAGLLDPDAFYSAVSALRLLDTEGWWWQLDPGSGTWLIWTGDQWIPTERPPEGPPLRDPLPPPSHEPGKQGPDVREATPDSQGRGRRSLRIAFFWFLGLCVLSVIGRGIFQHSLGTLLLLAATGVVFYFFRSVLAMALQAFDRLPFLRPIWELHVKTSRRLRIAGGVLAPILIGFLLTPILSWVLRGSGFAVSLVCIAVNTIIAHLFFGPAPTRYIRGQP